MNFSVEIAALQKQLAVKQKEEAVIEEEMTALIRQNSDLPKALNLALAKMKNRMTLLESDTSQLGNNLNATSVVAENVSGKVRELDVAKTRVVDCLQRVDDLLDLRLCTEGVQECMRNEDYEQAAQHIHRFLALDQAVFQMGEQWEKDTIPAGHSMKHSYEVLRQAENDMKTLVTNKFDEAVEEKDVASMERFFKIFPLLNQHEIGLEKFGMYLRTKIAEFAEKNLAVMHAGGQDEKRTNVLYADTITMLFEGIARIVEVHQPLVEAYYGQTKMLTLIKCLQVECDAQAEQIIAAFIKARQYEGKAKVIDKYERRAAKEKLDPLELDVLLSEVTLMHTRAELYIRFLRRRVIGEEGNKQKLHSQDSGASPPNSPKEKQQQTAKLKQSKLEREQYLDQMFNDSQLGRRMQELLGQYILMEQYYMSQSIKKAVQMDAKEEADALTSSVLDDVFFIVRKCIRRSLSSSSIDCVCAMINNGVALLETVYYSQLSTALKNGYPLGSLAEAYQHAAAAYHVIQQGSTGIGKQATPDRQREEFLTALNNLRCSCECIDTLKHSLNADFATHLTHLKAVQSAKLDHALGQLDDLRQRFETGARQAVDQLVESAVKTKLKSLSEAYLDTTHTPTDTEFADFEANDPFVEAFIAGLDKLIAGFESLLVEGNYQDLLSVVCAETGRQLERVILKSSFNRLGGLQLDKELRQLVSYLTNVCGWTAREKCARLTQVGTLLNVENVDEASESYQQSTITWRLTPKEVRAILGLRVDLNVSDLKL